MKPNPEETPVTNGRGEVVEIAIDLDRLIARCEARNLRLVAYLLRVSRDELSDMLGERARRH